MCHACNVKQKRKNDGKNELPNQENIITLGENEANKYLKYWKRTPSNKC